MIQDIPSFLWQMKVWFGNPEATGPHVIVWSIEATGPRFEAPHGEDGRGCPAGGLVLDGFFGDWEGVDRFNWWPCSPPCGPFATSWSVSCIEHSRGIFFWVHQKHLFPIPIRMDVFWWASKRKGSLGSLCLQQENKTRIHKKEHVGYYYLEDHSSLEG